jgi:hypothetical protein
MQTYMSSFVELADLGVNIKELNGNSNRQKIQLCKRMMMLNAFQELSGEQRRIEGRGETDVYVEPAMAAAPVLGSGEVSNEDAAMATDNDEVVIDLVSDSD